MSGGTIAIVGDGWAAWSVAAGLARAFQRSRSIAVITVPVADPVALVSDGDATTWLGILGIDPPQLIAGADATFRLGTGVVDGARTTFVPLADHAPRIGTLSFDQLGMGTRDTIDPVAAIAMAGRMASTVTRPAFHLRTAGYRAMLRDRALTAGVSDVAPSGIASIDSADLVVDTTGQVATTITHGQGGPALAVFDHDDTMRPGPTGPAMTLVTMEPGTGWRTSVPLRDATLVSVRQRTTAIRHRLAGAWRGRVVALGAAYGAIDGMEEADWTLVQKGITQLVQLFPGAGPAPCRMAEYNARMVRVHDELAMAALLRQRRAGVDLPLPETLSERIAFHAATGRLPASDDQIVLPVTWATMLALYGDVVPPPHPLVPAEARGMVAGWQRAAADAIAASPEHGTLLDRIDPR